MSLLVNAFTNVTDRRTPRVGIGLAQLLETMSLLSRSSFDLYCILSYYYFAMIELIKMDGWFGLAKHIWPNCDRDTLRRYRPADAAVPRDFGVLLSK